MHDNRKTPQPAGDRPREPLTTSAAFVAYEVISAAAFTFLFAPYALLKMIGAPAFRAGIGQRLSLRSAMEAVEAGSAPIWIQAVSLGEVKSVAPLARKIGTDARTPVFLTSTTATGYNAAKELAVPRKANAYFPLDFSPIAKRAISYVRPRMIVLFETEIWPNFIRTARRLGVPVTIVNGRISERSFRYYKFTPRIFKHVLSLIDFAGMQSQKDAERVLALGARPDVVEVCGNVKFDSAPPAPTAETVRKLRAELQIDEDAAVIIAGSTHEGEEAALLEIYQKILPRFERVRLVLAPRHPERFDGVESTIRAAGFAVRRKSRARGADDSARDAVILLDTVGDLAQLYSLASISFVGGSLAKVGGHNIIEPASMGSPVLFGPHMHHFEDVKEAFVSAKAAVCVRDEIELLNTTVDLLENPRKAKALGEAGKSVVDANRGATDRYYEALKKYF